MEEIFHSIRCGESEAFLAVPLGYCCFVCYWHAMGNIDLYGGGLGVAGQKSCLF